MLSATKHNAVHERHAGSTPIVPGDAAQFQRQRYLYLQLKQRPYTQPSRSYPNRDMVVSVTPTLIQLLISSLTLIRLKPFILTVTLRQQDTLAHAEETLAAAAEALTLASMRCFLVHFSLNALSSA